MIYVGWYQCWLNQFGTQLALAKDDQQQQQQIIYNNCTEMNTSQTVVDCVVAVERIVVRMRSFAADARASRTVRAVRGRPAARR